MSLPCADDLLDVIEIWWKYGKEEMSGRTYAYYDRWSELVLDTWCDSLHIPEGPRGSSIVRPFYLSTHLNL